MDFKTVKPEVNCYYQHRYGGLYKVQGIAISTVDKSKWVVYVHEYPFEFQTLIRPYDEWCDGRFRKIDNDEYNAFISFHGRDELQKKIAETKAAAKHTDK